MPTMLTLLSMLPLAVPAHVEVQDDKPQKALPQLTLEEPSAVPS